MFIEPVNMLEYALCTCVRREMKVCHQGHGVVLGVTFIFSSDHLLIWHLLYDFLPLKTENITLL